MPPTVRWLRSHDGFDKVLNDWRKLALEVLALGLQQRSDKKGVP